MPDGRFFSEVSGNQEHAFLRPFTAFDEGTRLTLPLAFGGNKKDNAVSGSRKSHGQIIRQMQWKRKARACIYHLGF